MINFGGVDSDNMSMPSMERLKKGDEKTMTYAIERMIDEIEAKGEAKGGAKLIGIIRKKHQKE